MAGGWSQTPPSSADGNEEDLVTVVVPARDEEAFIGCCLDSILRQTHRRLQVIVVDGASADRTRRVVADYADLDPRVELLDNPRAIVPVSLNLALAAARGRWLVRVDAHATVPEDYVATAVAHLRTGRWGGVGGRKDGVGRTPAGRAVAAAMASPFGVGGSAYHYAVEPRVVDHVPFGAYPVELVRRLGGWDARLAVNQDFELDHRLREAGHELLLDPAMAIAWHCRQSVGALFRQYHRYGQGKVAVARLRPASVRLRHLAAPALVASWGLALIAVLLGRRRAAAALVGAYAVPLAGASVWTARTLPGVRAKLHLPAAFAAMHVGWGLGFWRGAVRQLRVPRRAPGTTRADGRAPTTPEH